MWTLYDPRLLRDFEAFKELVALRHQAPTREWPLVVISEHDALLVLREWPDGSLTAYTVDTAQHESAP